MSEQEWICKNCLKTKNELVQLKMFHINFKEALYMCVNKGCVFPFNEGRIIYDYIVECKLDMSDSEESDEDDEESSRLANHSTENSHDRSITDSSCITSNGVCNSKFDENDILKAFDMSASCNSNSEEEFERAVDREIEELKKYMNCHVESADGSVFSDVPSPESGITEKYDQNNMLTCVMGNGMNSGKQNKTTCAEASVLELQPKDKTAVDIIQNILSENVNVFDTVHSSSNQEAALMEPGQSNSLLSSKTESTDPISDLVRKKYALSEEHVLHLVDTQPPLKCSAYMRSSNDCTAADLIPNLVAGKQTYTESSLSEESTSKWKGAGIQNSTGKNNTPELERIVGQKFPEEENDQVFIRKESALPEEKPGKVKETSVQKCAEQESCIEQKGAGDNESPPSNKNPIAGGHDLLLPKRSTRAKKKFCRDYHYY